VTAAPRQLALGLLQPPAQTLANFVAGRNAEALAAARELAAGRGPQFVYFWGPFGCGRTHLLVALAGGIPGSDWKGPSGLYSVDDVHQFDEPAQARLFALMNEVRADPTARLVATGDRPPAQLPLREDVRTRLAWGLALALQPLSEQDKADALSSQLAARGVRAAPDLIDYMLSRLPRDMRTLAAALAELDAYALEQGRALTVPLLRQWLHAQTGKMAHE
jgi:DnaA family protein